jgi:hypothetical protein
VGVSLVPKISDGSAGLGLEAVASFFFLSFESVVLNKELCCHGQVSTTELAFFVLHCSYNLNFNS